MWHSIRIVAATVLLSLISGPSGDSPRASYALLAAGSPGERGPTGPRPSQVSEEDSVDLHERARRSQADFERRRRRALPRTGGSGTFSSCDEVVGRFCLRFQEGGDWEPDLDSPEILQARDDLLDVLAEVGREIPGDRWVRGQRIHYLGEEGRWGEALDLVEDCASPAEGWWCHALQGYVLHRSDRYGEALEAFLRALGQMDGEMRSEWEDPEPLLDRSGRGVWGDAGPEDRDGLWQRLWALADPLYLVPGNDRLTEHYARRTASWIRDDARNPYGIRWGWDLTRLLVRYGSELGWERERPAATSLRSASVIGHHHPESRRYVPPGDVLADPFGFDPEVWDPEADDPLSSYAPPYAPELRSERFQVARFRRGHEMVVLAGYRLPSDEEDADDPQRGESTPATSGAPSGPVQAGLFLLHPDSGEVRRVRRTGVDRGGLTLRVPMSGYLASVEVWSPRRSLAGRVRVGVEMVELPPDVAAISDLLVLDPGEVPAADLEEAASRIRPHLRVCPGETVGVGWELYGLGLQRESVDFRLRVEATDRGFFQRAGEWLGLSDAPDPVTLEWTETGPDRPRPFFRSIEVRLPDEMEPGAHRIRLDADLAGRSPLRAERFVEVPDSC